MNDPIDLFREWLRQATASGPAAQPNAMCVSTVDASGVPHARFVDLKTVRSDGFVVLGAAARVADSEADAFFAERGRKAQLASWAFAQSATLRAGDTRASQVTAVREQFGNGAIPRPPQWGGYLVAPRRIEFMRFDADRAHERILYERHNSTWLVSEPQP